MTVVFPATEPLGPESALVDPIDGAPSDTDDLGILADADIGAGEEMTQTLFFSLFAEGDPRGRLTRILRERTIRGSVPLSDEEARIKPAAAGAHHCYTSRTPTAPSGPRAHARVRPPSRANSPRRGSPFEGPLHTREKKKSANGGRMDGIGRRSVPRRPRWGLVFHAGRRWTTSVHGVSLVAPRVRP